MSLFLIKNKLNLTFFVPEVMLCMFYGVKIKQILDENV